MQTYISLLRGINVSGHKIIKMDALRKMYEELQLQQVQTYIQSGNVIFQSNQTDTKLLEKEITHKIKEVFAFEVAVLVKEFAEMQEILHQNPFLPQRNEDIKNVYVTLLSQLPTQANIDKINGQFEEDEFVILDKIIYLYFPNGYGKTKLTNNFFENKLKVAATTRNWNTFSTLIHMAEKSKV